MKIKIIILSAIVLAGVTSVVLQNIMQKLPSDSVLLNLEALTDSEAGSGGEAGQSGAKCPDGCSDIGWGWNKILECDCNYDHFSCCDRWGC